MRSRDLNNFSDTHKYIENIKFSHIDTGRYRLEYEGERAHSTSTLTNSLCRLALHDEFASKKSIKKDRVLKHLNTVLLDAKKINELNIQIRDTQAERSGPKLFLRKIFKTRTLTEDQIIEKIKRSYEIGINNAIRDIRRNRNKDDAEKNQMTEQLGNLKEEIFQAIDKRNEEKPEPAPLPILEPAPKYTPPPKSRSKSKESSHEDNRPQNRSRSTSSSSSEEPPKSDPAPKPEAVPQVVSSSKSSSQSKSSSSEEQPKAEPAPEPEAVPQVVSSFKSSSQSKSSSSEEDVPSVVADEYERPPSPTQYEDDILPPDTKSFSSSSSEEELELIEDKPSPAVVTKKYWWEANLTASFLKFVQPLQNLVQNALNPKTQAPTPSPSVIASKTSTQRNSLSESEDDHLFQSLENSETESQPEPRQQKPAVQAEEAPPLPSLHPVSMSKNSSIPLSSEKQFSNPTPETKVQPEPSPEMPAVQGKKAPPPPPPPPVPMPKKTSTPPTAKQQPTPTMGRTAPPDAKDLGDMKNRLKKTPEPKPAERSTPTQPRDALLAEIQKKGAGSLKKITLTERPATKSTANLSTPTKQRNALLAEMNQKGSGSLKKIEKTGKVNPPEDDQTKILREAFVRFRPQIEDSSSEESSEGDWDK